MTKQIFFVHSASSQIEARAVEATKTFLNRYGCSSVDYADWQWEVRIRTWGRGSNIDMRRVIRSEATGVFENPIYGDRRDVNDRDLFELFDKARVIVFVSSQEQEDVSRGVRHELRMLASQWDLARNRELGLTKYLSSHVGIGDRPTEFVSFEDSAGIAPNLHPILPSWTGNVSVPEMHANAAFASLGARIIELLLTTKDAGPQERERAMKLCADRDLDRMIAVEPRLARTRAVIHKLLK